MDTDLADYYPWRQAYSSPAVFFGAITWCSTILSERSLAGRKQSSPNASTSTAIPFASFATNCRRRSINSTTPTDCTDGRPAIQDLKPAGVDGDRRRAWLRPALKSLFDSVWLQSDDLLLLEPLSDFAGLSLDLLDESAGLFDDSLAFLSAAASLL